MLKSMRLLGNVEFAALKGFVLYAELEYIGALGGNVVVVGGFEGRLISTTSGEDRTEVRLDIDVPAGLEMGLGAKGLTKPLLTVLMAGCGL
jgi:hypothetical protein